MSLNTEPNVLAENVAADCSGVSFVIAQKTLLNALSNIYSIVEKKAIIPVLSNIMIIAQGNALSLSAVNVDLSIIQTLPNIQIYIEGSTTVNAMLLTDIISKLNGNIVVAKQQDILYLKSEKSNFSLATLPANLFPDVRDEEYQYNFVINGRKLYYLLHNSALAISHDKSKQYLNGIFLHFDEKNRICSVATDGHRLICSKIDGDFCDVAYKKLQVILPRKTVIELMKITKNNNEEIKFFFDDHGVKFIVGGIAIFSKIIKGNFPQYQKIILQNAQYYFTTRCADLQNAVSRVALVAPEKTKAIVLSLQKNLLILSADSHELGSALEEVEIDFNGDEGQIIGLNALYIMDVLSIINAENVKVEFDNPLGPIRFIDEKNHENIYILMPVRV